MLMSHNHTIYNNKKKIKKNITKKNKRRQHQSVGVGIGIGIGIGIGLNRKHMKSKPIDFYNKINRYWIQQHHTHHLKATTNSFNVIQTKTNNQLINLITQKCKREKTHDAVNLWNLYHSIIHTKDDVIEKHIYECISILQYLREKQDNMYALFAWYTQCGFSHLFNLKIGIDEKDSSVYIASIQENGLSLSSKEDYILKDAESNERKEEYLLFIDSLFSLVFGKQHSYSILKIYEIEKQVAQYLYPDDMIRNFDTLYNTFSTHRIQKECLFDWNEFMIQLGGGDGMKCKTLLTNPSKITVDNPRYLKGVMNLLRTHWASEDWNNYWVYQIILFASKFHSKLYPINHRFFTSYYPSSSSSSSSSSSLLSKNALFITKQIMNTTLNKKYLNEYRNGKEILFVQKIAVDLARVLRERFRRNTWLSLTTINHAITKLQKMVIVIGNKDVWMPDPECDFSEDDSFANYMKYMNWILSSSLHNLQHKGVPSIRTWLRGVDQNVFDVNAFYNNNKNELIVPNAILQPPFVDIHKSMAYNYANIGTLLGHEMMHAFDDDGCKYDERGYHRNWMKSSESLLYKKKQDEIKRMYEDAAENDHETIRSNMTLGENIADIGGFLIAEQAFIEYLLSQKINDTVRQLGHLKLFYRFYAEKWKSIIKPQIMHQLYQYDIHSLAKYRVNCVLAMSSKFNEIYSNSDSNTKVITPKTIEFPF